MKKLIVVLFGLALAATAFAAPTKVVVYTAHEDSILNALAPRFEKDTELAGQAILSRQTGYQVRRNPEPPSGGRPERGERSLGPGWPRKDTQKRGV